MNTPTHRDEHDVPADEWQAQERALRAERLGLAGDAGDPRLGDYRRIARALRQPLPDPLPADFAERTARRARAGGAAGEGPERLLGTSLIGVLLLGGLVLGAWQGAGWWQALSAWALPPALYGPWPLALAACLGLTVLLEAWPRPRPGHR